MAVVHPASSRTERDDYDRAVPLYRHGPLVAGIAIAVVAAVAVLALQTRASRVRDTSDLVMQLSLDLSDGIERAADPTTVSALHARLLTAADSSAIPQDAQSIATSLGGAVDLADERGSAAYRESLRELFRAVDKNSRVVALRTQQSQMTIVAGAAIALILLLRIVAAARPTAVRPRHEPESGVDPLTGLGRIGALRQHLDGALAESETVAGFVGMLAVGIQPEHEHFLPLRRSQLDAALVEAAGRLQAALRATDMIVRLARNELAVALPASPRVEDAGRVAAKVIAALEAPFVSEGATVLLNPRVGTAVAPLDAASPDGLIERARQARRAASGAPEPGYRAYRESLEPADLESLNTADLLQLALEDSAHQLWVAYQPKIDLTSERVVGFEALARWDHPLIGSIPPGEFIAAAERSDLIVELGDWVINNVCAQLAEWRRNGVQLVPVSINVASRQFQAERFATELLATLEKHSISGDLVELELTERVLLEDRSDIVEMMDRLRACGVRIALDDFGTGYSALSYLKRFPLDVLKIDRSFVRDLRLDPDDTAISTAIIDMAHSMDLQVVAEGVETPEQLTALRGIGCDAAQGYYFAHPTRAADIQHRV